MSIFEKLDNNGSSDNAAFEKLCCQLFETWGQRQLDHGSTWLYRNIRGSGGDGGIEAYWHDTVHDDWIGLQAKWFRKSITPNQYKQIRSSIDTALSLRPSMHRYIVCIPHDLTSMKRIEGGKTSIGEDEKWADFQKEITSTYPNLQLELWDETRILRELQRPENEGCYRFWFEGSTINPEKVQLSLNEAIASLKSRYIPELADDGSLSAFLDDYCGTEASRASLIADIDECIRVSKELERVIRSFSSIGEEISDNVRGSARACKEAIRNYVEQLNTWRDLAACEQSALREIPSLTVNYQAIETLESCVQKLKEGYQLHGHVDVLHRLLNQFRELPSQWNIEKKLNIAFGSQHCIVIGDQGTGKTCGFAKKAVEYLDAGMHLPILIKASRIGPGDTWFEIVAKTLGLNDGWDEATLWQTLTAAVSLNDLIGEALSIKAKVVILVDGLDEKISAFSWESMIRCADAITEKYPRIQFAYSARPSGIEFDRGSRLLECTHRIGNRGDVPAWELFDRYIQHYNIDLDGHERLKWMIRTPMELSMFCTAYEGRRITDNVSTCMTDLVNAEIERLETEFRDKHHAYTGMHDAPVRDALNTLAESYLMCSDPLDRKTIKKTLTEIEIDESGTQKLIDFLEEYGILDSRVLPKKTPFSSDTFVYSPGSRHLWDYFMAITLIGNRAAAAENLLAKHPDAREMYGILLVEKKGILPLELTELERLLGGSRLRKLTFQSLAEARPDKTAKHRDWVLEEISHSRESLSDVVNEIVLKVANDTEHPLGPTLLDEYLRSFPNPATRDAVWSVPRKMQHNGWLATYEEREMVKLLPKLHDDDHWTQMPLLVAWGLSSVSNLRRRHYRSELLRWGFANQNGFVDLFAAFCNCDDPQIREDFFALAEEIVCQGAPSLAVEARLGKLVYESVFAQPDKPGNRDAAIRHYGRILIERCCEDNALGQDALSLCKPPYSTSPHENSLPIYHNITEAKRGMGFGTFHCNLLSCALVDELERAFGIPYISADGKHGDESLRRLLESSTGITGVEVSAFGDWAIAAAYQYALDHGYDPDVFEGPIDEDGYRKGGIDRKIQAAFGCTDRNDKSTVMSVAEKYIWCARNEICGFLADRIPAKCHPWMTGQRFDEQGRTLDYGMLLSFDSPLFEASATSLQRERESIAPSFPLPFSCSEDDKVCDEQELEGWIFEATPNSIITLLEHKPNVKLMLRDETIAASLYASDWSLSGKFTRAWAYSGVVEAEELDKLDGAKTVALNGFDHASSFTVGIESPVSYVSPVEMLAISWSRECDERYDAAPIADAYIEALPLTGDGVDSFVGVGDYHYRFPSELSARLCEATRTDGIHYARKDGATVFEDVSFGEPFQKEYQALLADKSALMNALRNEGYRIIWYTTLYRETNSLARERMPDFDERFEKSWMIWQDDEGRYKYRPISDTYPKPILCHEPSELIAKLMKSRDDRSGAGDSNLDENL